ncbi:MAG: MarR family transcriptional regulator [Chloroflexota bacterium]|nr:MarR family transcriptional regulator [Chloroflexota bacterium]
MATINAPLTNDLRREVLVDEVLGELTNIRMKDWLGALKRWQDGALSMVHLNVLMLLRSNGPLPMSRLADLLDVSVASATGIIDRMEKRGVVERQHSESDRRVVEIHLTRRGNAVFTVMDAERRKRFRKLVALMGDSELSALLIGLRALRVARESLGPIQ